MKKDVLKGLILDFGEKKFNSGFNYALAHAVSHENGLEEMYKINYNNGYLVIDDLLKEIADLIDNEFIHVSEVGEK